MSGFTGAHITALVERVRVNTRQQIIAVTKEKTADNLAAIGAATPFIRYVDGTLNKPLEQVSDHGFTLTQFELLGHVVDEAMKELILASPFGPGKDGHYRDDHWLYVNQTRRDFAFDSKIVEIGQNDEVVIVNVRPYARKIEGGARERFRRMTNRRPGLSVQAPNGVYEITARALQRRFGNIASIRFTYRGTIGAASPLGRARSDRYPALEITARGA